MARSVNRSASTGRFVSRAAAARWPGKTTTERVGSGTGNSHTVIAHGAEHAGTWGPPATGVWESVS